MYYYYAHVYIYTLFPVIQPKTAWKKYMSFPVGKKLTMTFKSLKVQVPAVESWSGLLQWMCPWWGLNPVAFDSWPIFSDLVKGTGSFWAHRVPLPLVMASWGCSCWISYTEFFNSFSLSNEFWSNGLNEPLVTCWHIWHPAAGFSVAYCSDERSAEALTLLSCAFKCMQKLFSFTQCWNSIIIVNSMTSSCTMVCICYLLANFRAVNTFRFETWGLEYFVIPCEAVRF